MYHVCRRPGGGGGECMFYYGVIECHTHGDSPLSPVQCGHGKAGGWLVRSWTQFGPDPVRGHCAHLNSYYPLPHYHLHPLHRPQRLPPPSLAPAWAWPRRSAWESVPVREYEAATAAASCAAGGDASNEPTLDAGRDRVTMARPGRRLGMTSERREAARPVPDTECVTDLYI